LSLAELVAATDTGDKDGNDNGQLSLTTNSLSASSLKGGVKVDIGGS
jgi:hypothetical protein